MIPFAAGLLAGFMAGWIGRGIYVFTAFLKHRQRIP